ncbi:PepSY domain-containing protein [Rhizobium rhizophilum]|uniref:PepSY domain-containing protein n=1 Tax=Rhizobium rhizophilum TaxID=1850373 RepID=UPI00197E7978|nr:hypothetical protein [Rhizobium rhizophilum]
MMDRRLFLFALLGILSAGFVPAGSAMAKDGGDSDGGGDSDNSGSGGSDDDSDDDDSDDDDDDSSGRGRGRGGDDDDDDDDDGDDRSGRGSGKDRDHLRAREAVDQGRILPLREILKRVDDLGGGRVISVDLNLKARAPYYTLKVQSGSRVKTLKLEAATGRKLNLFGW